MFKRSITALTILIIFVAGFWLWPETSLDPIASAQVNDISHDQRLSQRNLDQHAIVTTAQVTGTNSFQIRIPQRPSDFAVAQVQALVSLNEDAPVTFTITDPEGESVMLGPFSPGDPSGDAEFPLPVGLPSADTVTVQPPPGGLPIDDPARFRYQINIYPNTNTEFTGTTCEDVMPVPEEIFTVAVTTGPNITGACLHSLNFNAPGAECSAFSPPIQSTDPDEVATVLVGGAPAPQACGAIRPAVDAILVLDKSGSMNSSLGASPTPKIDRLHEAVSDFVEVWDDLRGAEATDPDIATVPDDQIGLLFFDADEHWMQDVSVPAWSGIADGLHDFDMISSDITSGITSVAANGSTSMGDGLDVADGAFDYGNDHRKVILLMSNGKENTTLRVKVDDPLDPQEVQTYTSGDIAGATALPNQDEYQVYAVTIGAGTAVSADINEDIATATGGFYINSEDNADLLRPFFLELLQNFLRFNTWETVRLVSEKVAPGAPYEGNLPVSTTTQSLSINLLWDESFGVLGLTVTPPGGSPIEANGAGTIRLNLDLPLDAPYDALQDWGIQVTLLDPSGNVKEAPFDLIVLGDDVGVKSDLSIVDADYTPGAEILLQARVTEFGQPILGLGANPDDRLLVSLVEPGIGIGDLLSDSSAETDQPAPDDILTDADAKLHNHLQRDPDSLIRNSNTIELVDNGEATSGDEVAGDGIYSALYPADQPGHYNFLFGVEGTAENVGRFSRQQLKTVHVRSIPDVEETEIQTNVSDNVLFIDMTPKTQGGHRMGPGWANYFWFTTSDGQTFKARDNLDGTYRASLNLSGNTIPPVTLHFLHVSVVIEDSITRDQLPTPLGQGTTLIEKIPGTGESTGIPWWWWLILLLILVVLILIWVWRRQQSTP